MKAILSFIVQNTWLTDEVLRGWGNGYVAVPKGHPWYGINYMDIDADVHGGLTYGQMAEDISHFPLEFQNCQYYIVGFDTCHYKDNSANCDKKYVLAETARLKKQAEEAANTAQ